MDILFNYVLPALLGWLIAWFLILNIKKSVNTAISGIKFVIESNNNSIDVLLKSSVQHENRINAAAELISRLTRQVKTLEQVIQDSHKKAGS